MRRNYYNASKRKREELKKIEDLLVAYGIVYPSMRLILRHNKQVVWQKSPVVDLHEAVGTLGRDLANNLVCKESLDEETDVRYYLKTLTIRKETKDSNPFHKLVYSI